MSSTDEKLPASENPERFTGLKLAAPMKVAAGIPAVIESAKHILSEMNAGRGLNALNKLKPEAKLTLKKLFNYE